MKSNFVVIFLLLFGELYSQQAFLSFEIMDSSNELIPAKMVIMQNEKPFDHKMESNETLACRENTIYTSNGLGSVSLPEGTYTFWFGKGLEYSIHVESRFLKAGKKYHIKALLNRELDTRGFVGGDMHLHTYTFSGHGDATVEERLISCAAEGLEWITSTDHNYVLDYEPYLKKLSLDNQVKSAVGNEVSTDIGHFNTYPIPSGSEIVNPKVDDGNELFKSIRENGKENVVIQVNHPRWIDSDYFNSRGFDPHFGTSRHPKWSYDFDAIEILNETTQLGWIPAPDNKFSVLTDWINLQNHGHRITGIGNSDTHSVIEMIAGVPRNYIISSTDDPAKIDEGEIVESIKNQRVSVSSGIFVDMIANEQFRIGDELKSNGKAVTLRLKVQAPTWISCHKAELLQNGVVIQTFDIENSKNVLRLDTTVQVNPKKDSWYMLIGYSDQATPPILEIKKKPIIPKGFTNPIWVKVDSDKDFNNIADVASKSVSIQETEVLLQKMLSEPEIRPYVFQTLFENKSEKAIDLTETFLSHSNTEERLMLYRELAKVGSKKSISLLQQQFRKNLPPLELLTIEWYLNFPIADGVESINETAATPLLNEQLSFLEREYLYLHSGSKKQQIEYSLVSENESEIWKIIEFPSDGRLLFKDILKEGKADKIKFRKSFIALRDTSVHAFLETNLPFEWRNSKTNVRQYRANAASDISEKFFKMETEAGKGSIEFEVQGNANGYLSFYPLMNKALREKIESKLMVEHLGVNASVKYLEKYNYKYHGFENALTNGIKGDLSYSSQLWQGWQENDFHVQIDLKERKSISEIEIGFLINQGSWIFHPENIEIQGSVDGRIFEEIATEEFNSSEKIEQSKIENVSYKVPNLKYRYLQIKAKNINTLPDWHESAGKTGAWIFVDEVVVR